MRKFYTFILLALTSLISACQTPVDKSALINSNPKSILILPMVNNSTEVKFPEALLAIQSSQIVSEAGYYTFSPYIIKKFFADNGYHEAQEIHDIPLEQLRKIFGVDAVLYPVLENFGTKYKVLLSSSGATVSGKLMDTHTGEIIWKDSATAEKASVGLLDALIAQIADSLTDAASNFSIVAINDLLTPTPQKGLAPGHRSPERTSTSK